MTDPSRRPVARWFAWGVAALAGLGLALHVASQHSAFHVQDDAYMFARYAQNLLAHGRASWDPGGEPTYGTTSLLYLAVVTPLCAVWDDQPARAVSLASLLSGVAALLLIARLCTRGVGAERDERPWLVAFLALALAGAAEDVAAHMTNGMDTMLDIAALALLLLSWALHQREPSRGRALWLGIWGGLCYAARPDLALYALAIPLAVAALSRREARVRALRIMALTAILILAQILAAKAYYGTPLPLGFYVKSLTEEHGEAYRRYYERIPLPQLLNYARAYWALILVIGIDLAFHWRRFVTGGNGLRLGVALATAAHVLYYLFGVVQVVAFHQRFYYPTLPALCFLAAWSALELWRDLRASLERAPRPVPKPVVAILVLWLLRLAVPPVLDGQAALSDERRSRRLARFDLLERYRRQSADFWVALDAFSTLPDELVIATTEVGHPAAMNPRKRIVDLVGLNEASFALHGFSADKLFGEYRPDVIYLPHPHYERMNAAIHSHPEFALRYEEFSAESLGAGMGLALRRDSPYYADLSAITQRARN